MVEACAYPRSAYVARFRPLWTAGRTRPTAVIRRVGMPSVRIAVVRDASIGSHFRSAPVVIVVNPSTASLNGARSKKEVQDGKDSYRCTQFVWNRR
jgi:hypothetical protein